MIQVEGYKAFHGTMRIVTNNPKFLTRVIEDTDWLYKPDTNCWYGAGSSFPVGICEVVLED